MKTDAEQSQRECEWNTVILVRATADALCGQSPFSRPLFTLTLFARCTAKGVCGRVYRAYAWLCRKAEPPRLAPMDPLARARATINLLNAQIDDLMLERDVARIDGYRARCAEELRQGEWAAAVRRARGGAFKECATWN